MSYHFFFSTTQLLYKVRCITIERKEAVRIGYNGFPFSHSYSGDHEGIGATLSTHAEAETRFVQYRPLHIFY